MPSALEQSRPVREFKCPKCGAQRGSPCRTLTTHLITDTHAARVDTWLLRGGNV